MAGMTPDVIVTWPTNCDYPLWRKFIREERERFGRIMVAFSPMPGFPDRSDGVMSLLDGLRIDFLHTRWEDGWDWRDAAVNEALDLSQSEWVWFTEQDFFVRDPFLWTLVDAFQDCDDVIGVRQDVRWHPCCLFVRRTYVERTRRYFGSDPVDHFYGFGQDLEAAGATFTDIDLWLPGMYEHMAGLSHNHNLAERGEPVTYRPDEFAQYLHNCIRTDVPMLPWWKDAASLWLSSYHLGEEV